MTHFYVQVRLVVTIVVVLLVQNVICRNDKDLNLAVKQLDCLFEGCTCSLAPITNYYAIKCQFYDEYLMSSSMRASPGFPQRVPVDNEYDRGSLMIDLIEIVNHDFTNIPAHSFQNLSIGKLVLCENNLKLIDNQAFAGLKHLESFELDEQKFEDIESGAFSSVYSSLTDLSIKPIRACDNQFERLLNELKHLTQVSQLSINHNHLSTLKADMFSTFENLKRLSLHDNYLHLIDEQAFRNNRMLDSLDLSQNVLENFAQLVASLKPMEGYLTELNLSGNFFSNDVSRTKATACNVSFSSLSTLNLARNGLTSLRAHSLDCLMNPSQLKHLDLSENNYVQINNARLNSFMALNSLLLGHNSLTALPSILELKQLNKLDVSNQKQESLTRVDDYAFERKPGAVPIEIDLSSNHITHFGDKAFCTHRVNTSSFANLDGVASCEFQTIKLLKLSYSSMKVAFANKCRLKQLARKGVTTYIQVVDDLNNDLNWSRRSADDYSQVCRCDLIAYGKRFDIYLTGLCQELIAGHEECNFDKLIETDPCSSSSVSQFECFSQSMTIEIKPPPPPINQIISSSPSKTTITIPNSNYNLLTSRASGYLLKVKNYLILIGCLGLLLLLIL